MFYISVIFQVFYFIGGAACSPNPGLAMPRLKSSKYLILCMVPGYADHSYFVLLLCHK